MSHSPDELRRAEGVTTGRVEDQRSLGEIVADVSQNFSTLVSQELALAKAEATQSAQRAGKGAGMLAGAAVAASLALLFLTLGLWWTIAIWIGTHDHPALGWSGLVMCLLWGIVAAILASAGKKALQKVQGLPRTTETVSKIPNAVKGNEEKNR